MTAADPLMTDHVSWTAVAVFALVAFAVWFVLGFLPARRDKRRNDEYPAYKEGCDHQVLGERCGAPVRHIHNGQRFCDAHKNWGNRRDAA